MSGCAQELCPNWAGDGGCPCAALDLPRPWTCPECGDTMPPGYDEEDHLNCNRDEDWIFDPDRPWGLANHTNGSTT